MRLRTLGSPILRRKCETVKCSLAIIDLAKKMAALVDSKTWLGLAAPQVGKSLRLFVAKIGGSKKSEIFMNPRIVGHSDTKSMDTEYCLSVPGEGIGVERWNEIELEYDNFSGHQKIIISDPGDAAILQHELDHLDGILIIDYRKE